MDIKQSLARLVRIEGVSTQEIAAGFAVPQDTKNGDYCLPCFRFARALKKAPQQIAESLASAIVRPDYVESVEAVAGYLNFKLSRAYLAVQLLAKADGLVDFVPKKKNGKTVCIDYSSINIAKPFHIGHLLTTVIGGSLYRIYDYLGYRAVGINHLGDWGTQFGKLIVAYKRWGSDEDIRSRNIRALLDLYVRFHTEAETDESLNEEGRRWFKKIEDGDPEALEIFEKFKKVTLTEVDKIYKRLGITFDSYAGESFYNDMLPGVVDELRQKGLLSESNGAQVVDLDAYRMPPCLILKSDGASLYATRDLAAAEYRKKTYDFSCCLYVVAYQQNLHFRQVFQVLELMGYEWAKDCVHVPFGMVSLENSGALSTRKGNVVFLDDVLTTSVEKADEIIREKTPDLPDRARVAEQVGVGAIVFSALSNSRIKDMVFSYDKALNFDGETGPYLQYTHARCCSILRKARETGRRKRQSEEEKAAQITGADGLCDDESLEILKLLSRFEETVESAAEKYEPSLLARYLIDLAQSFNKFYVGHRILENDGFVREDRLTLTYYVERVLKKGLELVLIEAPERM